MPEADKFDNASNHCVAERVTLLIEWMTHLAQTRNTFSCKRKILDFPKNVFWLVANQMVLLQEPTFYI